ALRPYYGCPAAAQGSSPFHRRHEHGRSKLRRMLVHTRSILHAAPLALFLAACGSATPASEAPMTPPAAGSTFGAGLPELDQAEADLDRALQSRDRETRGRVLEPKAPPKTEIKPKGGDKEEGDAEACSIACRALASMGRAADHVCALTSDGHADCVTAR